MENISKNMKEMMCLAFDGVMTQYHDGENWNNNVDYVQGAILEIMQRPHVRWRKKPDLKAEALLRYRQGKGVGWYGSCSKALSPEQVEGFDVGWGMAKDAYNIQ